MCSEGGGGEADWRARVCPLVQLDGERVACGLWESSLERARDTPRAVSVLVGSSLLSTQGIDMFGFRCSVCPCAAVPPHLLLNHKGKTSVESGSLGALPDGGRL